MTILIQSRPSNGASALVQAVCDAGLSAIRRRHESVSRLRRSSFLVNWGNSTGYESPHLNAYESVARAVNKLGCFNSLDGKANVPPSMCTGVSDRVDVNTGPNIWLARRTLTGSGGNDIVVVRPGDEWPVAPLYVQYIPKLVEYRVHVFKEEDSFRILTRQKLRESDAEQTNDQRLIRNRDNGWVFALVRDEGGAVKAEAEAQKAISALGLDFGAVDVIIGRDDGLAYVLEVNTAPGIACAATVGFYSRNIINTYNKWRNRG